VWCVSRQVVGVGERCVYLEGLTGVVARVYGGLVLAWVRVQLAAVDFDGLEGEGAVGELLVAAVLPLHYAFGAPGPLGYAGVSASGSCLAVGCTSRMLRMRETYDSQWRGSMRTRRSRRR
jgi:hypothetical protein